MCDEEADSCSCERSASGSSFVGTEASSWPWVTRKVVGLISDEVDGADEPSRLRRGSITRTSFLTQKD